MTLSHVWLLKVERFLSGIENQTLHVLPNNTAVLNSSYFFPTGKMPLSKHRWRPQPVFVSPQAKGHFVIYFLLVSVSAVYFLRLALVFSIVCTLVFLK